MSNHSIKKMKKRFILHPLFAYLEKVKYRPQYANFSYSQEGEDIILRRIFERKKKGFYVDVGAHHPKRFSNTFYFYQRGWHGINIDAMPGSMKEFERLRKKDINIEIALSDKEETLLFHIFQERALNTFSQDNAAKCLENPNAILVEKKEFVTQTLASVLDRYLPNDQTIDFLSIDVEGLDLKVLQSNNWNKYRPEVVLVEETCVRSLSDIFHSPIYELMHSMKYDLIAKTVNTLFFRQLGKNACMESLSSQITTE